MTVQQAIDEVRATVLDSTATYRWSDATLIRWINGALRRIFALRPDCVLREDDTAVVVQPPPPVSEVDDALPLEDRWIEAIVHYVCWRVNDTDSDELIPGAAGRAAVFEARFLADIAAT